MEDHASELHRVVAENRQFAERISFLEQELSMLKQIILQRLAAAPSTSTATMDHPGNIHRQSDAFVMPFHGDSEGHEGGSQQRPSRASPLRVGSSCLRSHIATRNNGESLVSLPQENDADGNNVWVEADVKAVTTNRPPSNIATRAKLISKKHLESTSTQTPYVYGLRKRKKTHK